MGQWRRRRAIAAAADDSRHAAVTGKSAFISLDERRWREVSLGVLLATLVGIILVITALVAVVWRNRVRRRHETPENRYRREILDLRGGGIHPGGQPYAPPKPNNAGGNYC